MVIRKYLQSDCNEIIELFFDTVHTVNLKDYSKAQIQAWAGKNISSIDWELWNKNLSSSYTLVTEEMGRIVGFGNITDSGYLDRLFVHKSFQRMGIASALLCELEQYAHNHNISVIESDVSITAKPFFEKNGYCVVSEQKQNRQGAILINYKMKKIIKSY